MNEDKQTPELNMKWPWPSVIIGTAIICISILIAVYFRNPHPCSESCIGCSSASQLFQDAWSSYVGTFGVIFGFAYIFYNVMR